ncbi:hypothetical protein BV898_02642 [Hypsibius exemplaris]|uniref:Uncharacterized protein n=1 Tax=Hypsibius exemplaris TaxID=2072580 RepID=A0A1W0X7L8_HYPEX|nr:hypothetical protein BV898_02642 [Hypsibius exemplaris]
MTSTGYRHRQCWLYFAILHLVIHNSYSGNNLPNVQLNFVGSQMTSYVHRPLLNEYSTSRTLYRGVHEFSNVLTNLPYDKFAWGMGSNYPRFTTTEDDWPAFIADTSPSNPAKLNPPCPGSPYISLPLSFYQITIIYMLDPSVTGKPISDLKPLKLKQDDLLNIFTGMYKTWGQLDLL